MRFRCLELGAIFLFLAVTGRAFDELLGGKEDALIADLARELKTETTDFERLRLSHLTF